MQVGGFSIDRTHDDGHLRISLSGELDLAATHDLGDELLRSEDEVRAGEVEGIVVDATQVTFIDSSGLGTLIGARKRLGERFTLVPGPAVKRLVGLSGTAEFFGL